ncbi:hypothetical protein G443_003184 [Actinoalloteichus cyanogriseus DSM 43889]|uniref:Uncharacterized protein n=1 Tax=Actinoalloteichus caeruleus DSM 43889 TaxID=1120930 RepID=A0ABT1JKU7_ACTCY|nr:hypothetical protein [Actinoalloteichus caeruleus DSM 43889]
MTRGLGREAGCSSVPASGQGRRRRSSTRRGGTGPSGPGRPRVSCADRGGGVSFSVELTRIAGPHNIGRMCIGRYYRLPPGQLVANPCPSGTTRMSVCQRPTGGVGRFATPLRRAAATGRRTRPAGCAGTTPEVRAALSGSACAGTRPGHGPVASGRTRFGFVRGRPAIHRFRSEPPGGPPSPDRLASGPSPWAGGGCVPADLVLPRASGVAGWSGPPERSGMVRTRWISGHAAVGGMPRSRAGHSWTGITRFGDAGRGGLDTVRACQILRVHQW